MLHLDNIEHTLKMTIFLELLDEGLKEHEDKKNGVSLPGGDALFCKVTLKLALYKLYYSKTAF